MDILADIVKAKRSNPKEPVRCCEAPLAGTIRCVYAKNKTLKGKIRDDHYCVRLTRAPFDDNKRDPATDDKFCHFACCDVFVYGLWLQKFKDEARFYGKDEFQETLKQFLGLEKMEKELTDEFSANGGQFPLVLSPIAPEAKAEAAKKNATKYTEALRSYWWSAVEHTVEKGDLLSIAERLKLRSIKKVSSWLDGTEEKVEELVRESQSQNGDDAPSDSDEEDEAVEEESASL